MSNAAKFQVPSSPDDGKTYTYNSGTDSHVLTDMATQVELNAHTSQATAAHAASAISFAPGSGFSSTDVQSAVVEAATDATAELAVHTGNSTTVHGLTIANVVTTSTAFGGVITGTIGATTFASDMATQVELDAHANNTTNPHGLTAANLLTTSSTFSGDVSGTSSTLAIGALKVTTGMIDAGAVTSAKLATDSVTATQIAADAVSTSELAASGVTTAKIAALNITTGLIADGAVTGVKIAALAVDTANIASSAVTSLKIADANVGVAKLSATGTASASTFLRGDNAWATPATVTNLDGLTDVTITSPTTDQIIKYDGSVWVNAAPSSNPYLDDLSDVQITAAATGDRLIFNGSNWTNTSGMDQQVIAGRMFGR